MPLELPGDLAPQEAPGMFVISLDFELFWGVRDMRSLAEYGRNILGVRDAIPRILDLFQAKNLHATWATVGFLFFDDKDELLASLPSVRPTYDDQRLSPYGEIESIGRNEREDPYHFGLSLIRMIQDCPGQEIGTHTFSHYYCLEPGQNLRAFKADLAAAVDAAARLGLSLKSIVFPRNQLNSDYLAACAAAGLRAYRGNQPSWPYDQRKGQGEHCLRRAARLLDAYLPLLGHQGRRPRPDRNSLVNLPASRFLRPYHHRLAPLDGLRLHRITSAMQDAARNGSVFHLWWHPHNFGVDLEENMLFLKRLLDTFQILAAEYGMQSVNMLEAAELVGQTDAGA